MEIGGTGAVIMTSFSGPGADGVGGEQLSVFSAVICIYN